MALFSYFQCTGSKIDLQYKQLQIEQFAYCKPSGYNLNQPTEIRLTARYLGSREQADSLKTRT